MMMYRCYLIGHDGKIKSSAVIECPTDAAAMEEAERRLATCGVPAIEVWDKARRVGIVGYLNDRLESGDAQNRGARLDLR
jgi:hypothetical protein